MINFLGGSFKYFLIIKALESLFVQKFNVDKSKRGL